MQINSGYGDAKEERLQRILVDFKFTDYSHETLESVTVNLKDLFEEYGYIPKAKAIPIEWIQNKYREKWEKDEMRRGDFQFCEVIHDLLEMWDLEKEDWEVENDKDI